MPDLTLFEYDGFTTEEAKRKGLMQECVIIFGSESEKCPGSLIILDNINRSKHKIKKAAGRSSAVLKNHLISNTFNRVFNKKNNFSAVRASFNSHPPNINGRG